MRIEAALRWMRVLWFLSLDLWRPCADDLWLGTPEMTNVQVKLQNLLDPLEEFPSFGSDPRARCYDHLQQLQGTCGPDGFRYLSDWQRLVFARGDDRMAESAWDQLAWEMLRSDASRLGPTSYGALKDLDVEAAERRKRLQENLELIRSMPLTEWDRMALAAEEETVESLCTLIENIAFTNAFVSAWDHHCTAKGMSLLTDVFDEAQRFISSEGKPHFLFSAELLPFPSSWEIAMLRNSDRTPSDTP